MEIKLNYGYRFKSLTYLKEGERKILPCGQKIKTVICKCDCGNIKPYLLLHFIRGRVATCGKCENRQFKMEDVIGKRYGVLTVIKELDKTIVNGRSFRMVQVKCDCGTIKTGRLNKIKVTKSCGCLTYNLTAKLNITHGMTDSRIYSIWQNMINRCYNKNAPAYNYYGARGIFVCDEWRKDFPTFLKWSLENGYNENLTIDRYPNMIGGYSPENCRWATVKQQQNNKTTNRMVTYKGESMTLTELCDKYNKNYHRVGTRISQLGWNIDKAMETDRINPIDNLKYRKKH